MLFVSAAFASNILPNAHFSVSASCDLPLLLNSSNDDDGKHQLVIFAPTNRSDTCFKTFSQHSDHNSRAIANDICL